MYIAKLYQVHNGTSKALGSTHEIPLKSYYMHTLLYLRGRIKGFTSTITAIMCQMVVIELWYGSYRTLKVVIEC